MREKNPEKMHIIPEAISNQKNTIRPDSQGKTKSPFSIILFDGVCNFCNGWVHFVIDHDPKNQFRFASLQSKAGKMVLIENGLTIDSLDTIVLVEDGRDYTQSTSIFRILRHLNGFWPIFSILWIVPAPVLDWVYRFIAAKRYRWFGKKTTCHVPTPELESRFLK